MSERNVSDPVRITIISHGDLDGIVSAALWVARLLKTGIKREEIQVIFAQPFQLPSPDRIKGEEVIVVDIAVNNRNPNQTKEFIKSINEKLRSWIDHHKGWQEVQVDDRFIIDEEAKAAAEIVYQQAMDQLAEYEMFVRDAVAADTREGYLSPKGQLIEEAVKSNLKDDSIRLAAVWWLVDGALKEGPEYEKLLKAQQRYRKIQEVTNRLINRYQIQEGIAVVDAREVAEDYDRTQLLIAGQKMAPTEISVVLGRNPEGEEIITVATSRKDLNLVNLFGLPSGAPFRVSLPSSLWPLERVLEKLKNL